MLNFDQDRFLRTQSGAVALAEPIDAAVATAVSRGIESVWFLGSGGAGILMTPAVQLLLARSGLTVRQENPAELVTHEQVGLGSHSLVVIPSLSGTTAESVAALEYCRRAGAHTITLVGDGSSPLGRLADVALVNAAADDTSSESFYLQSLLVALSLLAHTDGTSLREQVLPDLHRLPALLLDAKRDFEPEAQARAETMAGVDYHVVTGAGSTWPEAFYYGMCILEEMQWIRTRPVHASDFFHGTLELIEPGVSVIALKGEDAARPLVDRVEKFVHSYTDALWVLDSASAALPGISSETRALISPIVLATLLERFSAHLEVIRDHPLTTRRYYKRVAY